MTFTNYWLLIIWMFTGGIFFAVVFPKRLDYRNGREEVRWNLIPAILVILPYIIWAGFRTDRFGDTGTYRRMYLDCPRDLGEFFTYFESLTKDKGFGVYTFINKMFLGDSSVAYFLILAFIQMIIIAVIYRKYSHNYWMSIFLFVASTDYLSFAHNGLRQFFAVTIILAATPLMLKKKYIPLFMIILVAGTMHGSALLMIPIAIIVQGKPWNKKTVMCIIATAIVIASVEKFTGLLDTALVNTQYSNMVTDWQEWQDDGTNPIRVFIYCIPMLLSIIGKKYIDRENDPLINMLVNFSIITAAFALVSMVTSGIFIGRLMIYGSIYSTALLLPWEIDHMFEKNSAAIINGCMILGYVGFFYYQTHFIWALL